MPIVLHHKKALVALLLGCSILFISCASDSSSDTSTPISIPSVIIPDIKSVDESTAKILLAQKTLIPSIEYEFSDLIEKDLVIRTDPAIGSSVEQDQKVKIWISKGPKIIESINSTIEWSDGADDFDYYGLRIEDGVLIIDMEITASKKYELYKYSVQNEGFGRASISDTFSKTVPIRIITDNQYFEAKTLEEFQIQLSVNDLDVQKPTTIYIEIYFVKNDRATDYKMNFSASW